MSIKYRLPIKINGYIEFEDNCARGVIDTDDWEWSGLHVVTPYGEDPDVVEIVTSIGTSDQDTNYEADVNIVAGIRQALPAEIAWETK